MLPAAVVLFSGGIDSTTSVAIALERGFRPLLLSIEYGQRHRTEIDHSKKVVAQFGDLEQIIFPLSLKTIGGSALTSELEVPKNRPIDDSIPITYVPCRNLIFLSVAAAVGEVRQSYDLFYGANALDYSGYPDCRPEFIRSLEETINLGTRAGIEGRQFHIHAPLLSMTKSEIIRQGIRLGIDYTHTFSCYDPTAAEKPCGSCDSCILRRKGFEQAGIKDPAAGHS